MTRLEEIRKRNNSRFPGRWQAVGFDGLKEGANFHDFSIVASQVADEDIFITNIGSFVTPVEVSKEQATEEWATAQFIAHAPEDIAYLLGLVAKAEAMRKALQEGHDKVLWFTASDWERWVPQARSVIAAFDAAKDSEP